AVVRNEPNGALGTLGRWTGRPHGRPSPRTNPAPRARNEPNGALGGMGRKSGRTPPHPHLPKPTQHPRAGTHPTAPPAKRAGRTGGGGREPPPPPVISPNDPRTRRETNPMAPWGDGSGSRPISPASRSPRTNPHRVGAVALRKGHRTEAPGPLRPLVRVVPHD